MICYIPISQLIAAPYNLNWGATVYAKISATNVKGTSAYSSVGSGGIIAKAPDAPINLVSTS